MAFVKFEKNRFRIDGEIAENHAILVNLTASIIMYWVNRNPNPNPALIEQHYNSAILIQYA